MTLRGLPTPERPSLRQQIDAATKRFGAGATYTREERNLITDGIVPEYALRGRKFLKSPQDREDLDTAIKILKRLRPIVLREIPVGKEAGGDAS